MKKSNNLAPIYSQYSLDNLSADRLKRLYAEKVNTPVNKAGVQITSAGFFVGYERGNYEKQVIELEFYKD